MNIWCLGPSNDLPDPAILNLKKLAGYIIRASWWRVENDPSFLANAVIDCVNAKKPFKINITPGRWSPPHGDWQRFEYVTPKKYGGSLGYCPIPWDVNYLNAFTEMIASIGILYARKPFLQYVNCTGINYDTEEIGLPPGVPGYTREKALAAWTTITAAWKKAFPNQTLCTQILPRGFPIGTIGNWFDFDMPSDLCSITKGAVQWNGLQWKYGFDRHNGTILADVIASEQGSPLIYQANVETVGDPHFINNNGTPCGPLDCLNGMIAQAAMHEAVAVELYPKDAELLCTQ